MKKSSFKVNSRLVLLVLFLLCAVLPGVMAQKATPVPKSMPKQSSSTTAAKPHKKVKKKKGRGIVHHSDDDKKLKEIKAAKAKLKNAK